jgi:hypothetical protein
LLRRRLAERNLQQGTGQIDAAQPRIHRLDKTRVGVDEIRNARCVLADVVERQRAVPVESLPDPRHDLAHRRANDAALEHVAAARPFHDLAIDMARNQASAVEHGLRTLERSRHRGLDQQALGE